MPIYRRQLRKLVFKTYEKMFICCILLIDHSWIRFVNDKQLFILQN